ncbi:unnamed protein product, partial [Symbiodinium sp. KB8]
AMGLTDPGNLPVANPFHSEKVKTEVQLLRHRPGSLDEDAAKIRTEVDESALGNASWTGGLGEPDYMSMMGPAGAASVDFPGSPDEGSLDARGSMGQSSVAGGPVPRVARVEPVEHGFASTEVRDGSWKHGRPTEEPQASGRAGHDATFEGVKEEPEAVGADDPRELIPAREDRLSRVEALLSQVLEENQALRLGLTKEELYASGAESLTVKVAITFAARHKHWKGVTIDVKSAFLYAPIRSDAKGTDERIVVKPPYLLVELGLLNKDDRWWVRKALYGLPTSPRDWGRYRDAEFQKVRITWQGCEYCLEQTKSDDALWLLRTLDANGMGSIEGVLVVYVDDLALFAPEGLAKEFIQAIQMRLLSGPSHVGGKLWVTFRVIQEDSIISLMGDNEAAIRIEAGLLHVSHLPGLAMLAAIPQVTGQPLQAKLIQEELRVGLTLGEVFPFLALAGMWSFSLWGLEKGDNGFRSQPRRF